MQSERRGDHVVVSLWGELDVFNAAAMTTSIESAVPPDAHGAVLDLTGLGFVDSTAIRKLFARGRTAHRAPAARVRRQPAGQLGHADARARRVLARRADA